MDDSEKIDLNISDFTNDSEKIDLNISDFTNDLEKINFNFLFIEEQIKEFKYNQDKIGIRNGFTENGIKLPSMIESFYNYIFKNQKLPDFKKYMDSYMKENSNWFEEYKKEYKKEYKENSNWFGEKYKEKELENIIISIENGIKYRLWKSFPSFIRDLHFCLLLKSKTNLNVTYNKTLDIEYGIDILINHNNLNFGVKLYTDTKNGNFYRKQKDKRHLSYNNIINIDLSLDLKKCKTCGDIYLYSQNEIELLNAEMAKRSS